MLVQSSFDDYIQRVDAFYDSKKERYSAFSFPADSLRSSFFSGFMYLMERALKGNERIVNFSFPSFDMGRGPKLQAENTLFFLSALRSSLLYATSIQNCKLLNLGELKEGDLLFVYEKVRSNFREKVYDEPRFYSIQKCKEGGLQAVEYYEITKRDGFPFKCVYRSNKLLEKYYPERLSLKDFSKFEGKTIRLSNPPSGRWSSVVEKLIHSVDDIKHHSGLESSYPQFSKIAVVGLGKHKKDILPFDDTLLSSQIVFTDDFDDIRRDKDYELLIFIDNKHKNRIDVVRDKLNKSSDSLRKVIILGQDCPEGDAFPFSVREWIHYFVGDKYYPTIIEKQIPFPWLKERISELKGILDEDSSLSQEAKASIIHRVFYPFMTADFNRSKLADDDDILSIIGEEYAGDLVDYEVQNRILNWYNTLNYSEESNPKQLAINELIRTGRRNLIIPRTRYAYKREIRSFIKQGNTPDNMYIFDGIRRSKMEVFSDLLDLSALGTYYFLYYDTTDIKHLRDYFTSQYQLQVAPLRVEWLDGIKPSQAAIIPSSGDDVWKVEEDWTLDVGVFDEIESTEWNTRNSSYLVTFTDGESSIIQGPIIYNNEVINIDTLADSQSFENKEITFYECLDRFSELMTLFKNYPQGQDEDYFAQLWIDALKKMYVEAYGGQLDMLSQDLRGIKKSDLGRYVSKSYSNHFPGRKGYLPRICRLLFSRNYMSWENMQLVLRAKDFRDENTSHGQRIKKELLEYRLSRRLIRNGVLYTILENGKKRGTPISLSEIESFALHTKEIKSIKKYKDDNDEQ